MAKKRRVPGCRGGISRRLAKYVRFGHDSVFAQQCLVLKRGDFQRWQHKAQLSQSALCAVVEEMRRGLVGARLSDALYKKRVPREGGGKRGGYRVVVSAWLGTRYVFLHGFAKSEQADVSLKELKALRFVGNVFLGLSAAEVSEALRIGVLVEVQCGQQDH